MKLHSMSKQTHTHTHIYTYTHTHSHNMYSTQRNPSHSLQAGCADLNRQLDSSTLRVLQLEQLVRTAFIFFITTSTSISCSSATPFSFLSFFSFPSPLFFFVFPTSPSFPSHSKIDNIRKTSTGKVAKKAAFHFPFFSPLFPPTFSVSYRCNTLCSSNKLRSRLIDN